ncbi:16899_t:CDS:2 [Funneliformis geosporum]|uniref:6778_t:CDS:1 n=1 Tax=Funneliformis geosporum TaxID=1117311 RepID=A0A9W4SQ89_9GLOM|nr:16899_t:CDS:2 [Funneliformis geosporum]CAI2177314.1 6778_t:CDS:2 [Funneliformis geosporum]
MIEEVEKTDIPPNPKLLDKWTQMDVKNHFRNQYVSKMRQYNITHYELESFLSQKLIGRDLLYISFDVIYSFGMSYGSARRICEELVRLKQCVKKNMATFGNSTLDIRAIKREDSDGFNRTNLQTCNYILRTPPNDGLDEFSSTSKGLLYNRNHDTWTYYRKFFNRAIMSPIFVRQAISWTEEIFEEVESYWMKLGGDNYANLINSTSPKDKFNVDATVLLNLLHLVTQRREEINITTLDVSLTLDMLTMFLTAITNRDISEQFGNKTNMNRCLMKLLLVIAGVIDITSVISVSVLLFIPKQKNVF